MVVFDVYVAVTDEAIGFIECHQVSIGDQQRAHSYALQVLRIVVYGNVPEQIILNELLTPGVDLRQLANHLDLVLCNRTSGSAGVPAQRFQGVWCSAIHQEPATLCDDVTGYRCLGSEIRRL